MHNSLTNEITFTHNNKRFVLYALTPSHVLKDQVQMKKIESDKKKSKNLKCILKDELKVWELYVPSHEVTQKENILTKKVIKHILVTKQPLYLLMCTPTCTSSQN